MIGNKAIVIFDLEQSIPKQTKKTNYFLCKRQGELKDKNKIKVKSAKNRAECWRDYLRVYDAYNEKASPQEIAKIVFPDKSNEGGNEGSGAGSPYQGSKTVSNNIKQAKRMVDGGFKSIRYMGWPS